MTHYELQVTRNKKYADRTKVLIQTPKFLMFVVDDKVIYCHEYDDSGRCVNATWSMVEDWAGEIPRSFFRHFAQIRRRAFGPGAPEI